MRHVTKPFIVQSKKKRRSTETAAQPLFTERQLRLGQEQADHVARPSASNDETLTLAPAQTPSQAPRILPDLTFDQKRFGPEIETAPQKARGRLKKPLEPVGTALSPSRATEHDSTTLEKRITTDARHAKQSELARGSLARGNRWKRRLTPWAW